MPNLTGLGDIAVKLRSERSNLTDQLRHIDAALSVLGKLNGSLPSNPAPMKRSGLSAAARRKISIAQKTRWAKRRTSPPNSHRMSAAARRKISFSESALGEVKAANK